MQLISNCSQYDPYAGKTTPCGGNVHELTTKYNDDRIKPTNIQVCDAHMQSFIELGRRIKYLFTIVEDKIIGTIEGQRPTGEKK